MGPTSDPIAAAHQAWNRVGARSTEDLQLKESVAALPPGFASPGRVRAPSFSSALGGGIGNSALPLPAALGQLMLLRSVAVGGQAAAIMAARALNVALPLGAMLSVVGALALLNALTWARLRSTRSVSRAEIAAHLGADLAALTILLALSGGVANPFSTLLVVHAVLLALLLPLQAAMGGAACVIGCYLLVSHFHLPLVTDRGEPLAEDILATGNALGFALTVVVIAWLVTRIVATMRDRDRLLNEAAQTALRDEAVLRVGALAAAAAHELAGPLTAMAVAAGEIVREAETTSLREDARVLVSQLGICRDAIDNMMTAAGHARAVGGGRDRLDRFLDRIAEKCRTMHPEALIGTDWKAVLPASEIFSDQGLEHALLALLNNAADASPKAVEFSAALGGDALRICIADRGAGVSPQDLGKLGRAFFTTKAPGKGTGLGLVVAARAVERLGGSVRWENRPGGGLRVEVALSLKALQINAETT